MPKKWLGYYENDSQLPDEIPEDMIVELWFEENGKVYKQRYKLTVAGPQVEVKE